MGQESAAAAGKYLPPGERTVPLSAPVAAACGAHPGGPMGASRANPRVRRVPGGRDRSSLAAVRLRKALGGVVIIADSCRRCLA
jgi:hypothetical protein